MQQETSGLNKLQGTSERTEKLSASKVIIFYVDLGILVNFKLLLINNVGPFVQKNTKIKKKLDRSSIR
jgi:hypothetical protein